MILKTKRLILREPLPEDLDPMFRTYNDPIAMRYWSSIPHPDKATTKDLLDRRIKAWSQAPINFQITVDDAYIGNAGNYTGDEIGFMLNPKFWRQGILTEALQAIIPHLWATTKHLQLTADADPMNAASCGLLRKMGFTETHRAKNTFCINEVWSDSVYFALTRPSL